MGPIPSLPGEPCFIVPTGHTASRTGSVSVSAALVNYIFSKEISTASNSPPPPTQAKLDSDPHFWMPLTLSAPAYATGMANKGVPADVTQAHYLRMTRFKAAFLAVHPGAWRREHGGGGLLVVVSGRRIHGKLKLCCK